MAQNFDLYEFPESHIGAKRYVSVRGHSRSIPAIYTYKGADRLNYILPEFGGTYDGVPGYAPNIMRDMEAYVSPLDGSTISSRSQHREHVLVHNVIELGNETVKPLPEPKSTFDGYAVKRHLDTVRGMSERQYREHINSQRRGDQW